jgi:SAM-dependent methyltransferase
MLGDEVFVPMNQKNLYLQSEGDAWFMRNLLALEAKNAAHDIDFLLSYLAPLKGKNTKKKFRFLEIGCGSGHKTKYLAENLMCGGGVSIHPLRRSSMPLAHLEIIVTLHMN